MSEKETTSNRKDSESVKKFMTHLENGTNIVQKVHDKPSYAKNFLTGSVPTGFSQYNLLQGLSDNSCKSTLYITQDQKAKNNYFNLHGGAKPIGYVMYKTPEYWKKDDPEVIAGKAKAGESKTDEKGKAIYKKDEKGKDVISMAFCQAAELIVEPKFKPSLGDDGQPLKYTENVYAKDGAVYTSDRYDDKGNLYGKKGEPVIEHFAGTMIGENVPSKNRITPAEPNNLAALEKKEDLYPLPECKDNKNAFEVLKCGMAKAFRGIYNGTGESWNPTKEEIELVKNAFIQDKRNFLKCLDIADTYGRGNKVICEKMEKNIQAKQLANLQAQKEENKNINTNTKHKGRI